MGCGAPLPLPPGGVGWGEVGRIGAGRPLPPAHAEQRSQSPGGGSAERSAVSAAGPGAGSAGTKPGSGRPRWSLGGGGEASSRETSGRSAPGGASWPEHPRSDETLRGASEPRRTPAARRLGTLLRLREGDPGLSGAAPAVGRE